jgi:hypothetical protein
VGSAQTNPTVPAQRQQAEGPLARLTLQQKQQFDEASKAFGAQRYADALAIFKRLLTELPGNALLSKFACEAALNTDETGFALDTVRPVAQANPDDWQAAALLARACAEADDKPCRTSQMAHIADLQSRGLTPPGMQAYLVERVKVGENILLIRMSLVPWGIYKVWALGQLMNAEGKIFFRATVESSDADQVFFAKTNPEDAAKGIRQFSLDGYLETGTNSNGQRTQTHYTYKFFVGQPSYDTVREEFVNIAAGKTKPRSARTNLIVP